MSTTLSNVLEYFVYECASDTATAQAIQRIQNKEGVTIHPHKGVENTSDRVLNGSVTVSPDDLREDRNAEIVAHDIRITEVPGTRGTFEIAATKGDTVLHNSGRVVVVGDKIKPSDQVAYDKLSAFICKWIVAAAESVTTRR